MAYGNKHNDLTGLRHPFIIEIDENGLITPIETLPDEVHTFTLYGNPVSEEIRIHAEFSGSKHYTLLLGNVPGQIVFQSELSQGMNVFDVRKLPVGNYFYSIVDSYVISIVR